VRDVEHAPAFIVALRISGDDARGFVSVTARAGDS
jgi:hypothetical protein